MAGERRWSSSPTNWTVVDELTVPATTTTAVNSSSVAVSVDWSAVALGLIVVATVFGNSLLCAAVVTERRLQNMTNYFLASLAVADLLVAVVVMPLAVVVQIYGIRTHAYLRSNATSITSVCPSVCNVRRLSV